MKIALLGPNGQLGADVRNAVEKHEDITLHAIDRSQLDVTNVDAIATTLASLEFDILLNCTSYHKTDEVEDNAGLAVSVNAHAVEAMAQQCTSKGARFFHISTDYVFGGDEKRSIPLTEEGAAAPINVYGASKAYGETLARMACEQTFVFRVASLFGVSGASGKGGNFVETMIKFGNERGHLKVVSDQHMCPTSTYDIAEKLVKIAKTDCDPGIYNVVNSGSASWYEFAQEIIRQAGVNATVEPCTSKEYVTRAKRPMYSVLDNSKLQKSISPMRNWREALAHYLNAKGYV